MAEYSTVVKPIGLRHSIESFTTDEVGNTLGALLNEAIQQMNTTVKEYDGGHWDIISHDITRLGSNLIISYLLRR